MKNVVRKRVSVPSDDEAVLDWFKYQHNISFSVRWLIKSYIEKYGISDPTCGNLHGVDLDEIPSNKTKTSEPIKQVKKAKTEHKETLEKEEMVEKPERKSVKRDVEADSGSDVNDLLGMLRK